METTRTKPGLYRVRHGRGEAARTFEMEKNPEGYEPGWAVRETGLFMPACPGPNGESLPARNTGVLQLAEGLGSLRAAKAVVEAELGVARVA